MTNPKKILLQTTIPYTEDDWHIGRFSLLAEHLRSLAGPSGEPLYDVTMRNRESGESGADPVMSRLDASDFDQVWLFAVDTGDGLSPADCAGITRFRMRGGGILSVRDHFDLGSSLCTLAGIGEAHYFHSRNPDPDITRHRRDDPYATTIDFPNYHSGANGDYQTIEVIAPHELLRRTDRSYIEHFPAHPHEGGVGAPAGNPSHVIAQGTSKITGRNFNLIVASERHRDAAGNHLGRAIAESSFHHFADYNWDTDIGCPSFLEESPGDGYKRDPEALNDIKQYVENAANWLAKEEETAPEAIQAGASR